MFCFRKLSNTRKEQTAGRLHILTSCNTWYSKINPINMRRFCIRDSLPILVKTNPTSRKQQRMAGRRCLKLALKNQAMKISFFTTHKLSSEIIPCVLYYKYEIRRTSVMSSYWRVQEVPWVLYTFNGPIFIRMQSPGAAK